MGRSTLVPIFDLDGTLIDSDAALLDAFVALGVDRDVVTFGHVLDVECDRLGISLEEYLDVYDESSAAPYAGASELVGALDRWAVCSNKHPRSGRAELARLGWRPEVALFTDAFGGPKRLQPVLDALGLSPGEVLFIGDTDHDRRCAADAGVPFVLAGWNERARTIATAADVVVVEPKHVLDLLTP